MVLYAERLIYMEMVGTTVNGVRHFDKKGSMFPNRKYSMIWISLDDDGPFLQSASCLLLWPNRMACKRLMVVWTSVYKEEAGSMYNYNSVQNGFMNFYLSVYIYKNVMRCCTPK